jgi:outer membrane protein assembly factor BamB
MDTRPVQVKGGIMKPARQLVLKFAIVWLVAISFGAGFDSRAQAADWPQFLGPQRNGTSTESGLLSSWPAKGPPKVWTMEIGSGYSGPVIAGQHLIVFERTGNEEVVECLEAATGKSRWRFAYPTAYQVDYGKGDGPRATPLVAGGRVFTLGAEGRLHCLALDTGAKVWARDLQEDYHFPKGFFGLATSPLLVGERLLVNVGGREAGIVAFAAGSGKELWRATSDEASYSSPVAATIAGRLQVFFLTREGLVSVDPASGHVFFRTPWRSRFRASVNAATPLVMNDLVFVSASYNTGALLVRVGKEKAEEVWQSDEVLSNHYNTSIHSEGYLYGCDGRQEEGARLRCVELQTGKVKWTQEGFGCGSAILADGKLIVLAEDGDLVMVVPSPKGYEEKARAKLLNRPCRAPLALANGFLYARDERQLICLDLRKH